MKKKLTSESFQSLYPAPAEDFSFRMAGMLHGLASQRKEIKMKKKLSAGLALAMALMLVTFGALAAIMDWNVLAFLFEDQNPAAAILKQDVNARATDGQVTLTINSALTDGNILAMDWTIVNEEKDAPVFVAVDAFTVNGIPVWTDGTDSFDRQWLPGWCSEDGSMQDGETIAVPQAAQDADTLEVALKVGVYSPRRPLYLQEAYDPAEGAKKIAEGYLVVPEGEGWLELDPEEANGVAWITGANRPHLDELFTRTELSLSFTLDQQAGRASVRQLETAERYETALFAARYTQAFVSPLGLTLSMDLLTSDVEYSFTLTDGAGSPLEAPSPSSGEMTAETAADGSSYRHLTLTWYGLTEDMLPDVISLSYFPESGEPLLFPIQVR